MQAASSPEDCTSFEGWCHKLSCARDCKEKSADSFCSCCCHSYYDNIDTAKILRITSKVSTYAMYAKYAGSGATKMTETSTATETAAQVVTKSGLKTLAKNTFVASAVIEGTLALNDIMSSYKEKQQAISNLKERGSDNIEEQVKHIEDQFNKEVVERTMSAAGSAGGTAAGVIVGSVICPGLGTIVGGTLGNIAGGYVGSKAGETVGGAMYDSDKE